MSSGRVSSAFAEAGYDSVGELIDAEPATESELVPGDDGIQPVGHFELSSYLE